MPHAGKFGKLDVLGWQNTSTCEAVNHSVRNKGWWYLSWCIKQRTSGSAGSGLQTLLNWTKSFSLCGIAGKKTAFSPHGPSGLGYYRQWNILQVDWKAYLNNRLDSPRIARSSTGTWGLQSQHQITYTASFSEESCLILWCVATSVYAYREQQSS